MTIWTTNEAPPRTLIVKGRSAVDPDCLVAYLEGSSKPLWIIDGGSGVEGCHVCGLEGTVTASLTETHRERTYQPRPTATE